MNKQVIMQIIRESEEIPDSQFRCGCGYTRRSKCSHSGGWISYGPLGHHILKHPEIKELLDAIIKSEEYPYSPTISEMLKSDQKSFTVSQEWLTLDSSKLEKYLGLGYEHVQCLFYSSRFTRKEFIDTVTAFVNGELDIRICRANECEVVYTTSPDDEACVCDNCKEDMLYMCGM